MMVSNICRPNTPWTWAFLIAALIQAAIILAIESYVLGPFISRGESANLHGRYIFAKFQESLISGKPHTPLSKTIPVYLTLFIFGFLYQLVLVYDSLRLKNTIQVLGLCCYNGGMLIYASIQYDQVNKAIEALEDQGYIKPDTAVWTNIQPFLVAVPCIIALFTVALSVIAWKLYDEFAWTIYKHISADLRMKRRYLTYQVCNSTRSPSLRADSSQIYIALLKFDFFFFLGFTVQFLVVVTGLKGAEFGLTIAAIPVTVVILFMASFWTRREDKAGMIVTIFLFFCGLAYFVFKLARMYQPSHEQNYLPVRKSLTSFAAITIVLIVMTIVNACVCTANFGMGLKPHIQKRRVNGDTEKMDNMTELPDIKHGPVSSRMTID
jgi:uncharacterized membrane protein YidH (DUF202 family)